MPQLQADALRARAPLGAGFESFVSNLFPPAQTPQPPPPAAAPAPPQTPTSEPTTEPTTAPTTAPSSSSSSRRTTTSRRRTAPTTAPTTSSTSSTSSAPTTSARPTSTSRAPPSSSTSIPLTTVASSITVGGSTVVVQVTQTGPPVIVAASSTNESSGGSSNGGLIGGVVGGVVGGLALLTAAVLLLILLKRRKARTGHAWFLCFGRKPRSDDGEGDWPTFDPNQPSLASAAGTQRRKNNEPNPTLPPGFDDDPEDAFVEASSGGHHGEMREYGALGAAGAAVGGAGAYSAYGSRSRQESNGQMSEGMYSHGPLSNAGPTSHGGPSDDGHFPLPVAHPSTAGSNHAGIGTGAPWSYAQNSPPQTSGSTGPDYAHLDPPEVREARARQYAAEAAAGAALGRGASYTAGSEIGSGTTHAIPPALAVGAASSQAHHVGGAGDFYEAPLASGTGAQHTHPEKRQSIASIAALSQNGGPPAPPYSDVRGTESVEEVDYAVPAGTRERLHLSNPDDA